MLFRSVALFQDGKQQNLVEYIGVAQPHTEVPVALLVTEDVSASDWLAFGLKGSPNARLFGPFETNGGFSTRYVFGYWLGVGYIIAVSRATTIWWASNLRLAGSSAFSNPCECCTPFSSFE